MVETVLAWVSLLGGMGLMAYGGWLRRQEWEAGLAQDAGGWSFAVWIAGGIGVIGGLLHFLVEK